MSDTSGTWTHYRQLVLDFIEEVRKRLSAIEDSIQDLDSFRAVIESKSIDSRLAALHARIDAHIEKAFGDTKDSLSVQNKIMNLEKVVDEFKAAESQRLKNEVDMKKLRLRATVSIVVAVLTFLGAVLESILKIL